MSKTVIINAKGTKSLKEAIRIVAFNNYDSNSSRAMVDILKRDPRIAKELKKMEKKIA